MSHIEEFLQGLRAVLEKLPLDEDGKITGEFFVINVWDKLYHYDVRDDIGFRCTFVWNQCLDYRICSEGWWWRNLCRLAHGDECGSKAYLALRKKVKQVRKGVLVYCKESVFESNYPECVWAGNRDVLQFSLKITVDVPVRLLSRQVFSTHWRVRELARKLKREKGCSVWDIKDKEFLDMVSQYRQSLVQEVGFAQRVEHYSYGRGDIDFTAYLDPNILH